MKKLLTTIMMMLAIFAVSCNNDSTDGDGGTGAGTPKYHTTTETLKIEGVVEYNSTTDTVISPEALKGKTVGAKTDAFIVSDNYFATQPVIEACTDDATSCSHGATFLGSDSKSRLGKTGVIETKTYGLKEAPDGLDDISAEYQLYATKAIAKGIRPWVNTDAYTGTGSDGLTLSMIGHEDGNLGFDIAQKDNQLRLFTSTLNSVKFTFHLLLVSKTDKNRGKFLENVSYTHPTFTGVPAGTVEGGGSYYWNINTGLTSEVLATCDMYMIVTQYEGYGTNDVLSKDNVIRMK